MSVACYLPCYHKDHFLLSCDTLLLHTSHIFFAMSWNLHAASACESLQETAESTSLAARLMTLVATMAIMMLVMVVRMCSHSIPGMFVEIGRWLTREYNQSEFHSKTLMLVIYIYFFPCNGVWLKLNAFFFFFKGFWKLFWNLAMLWTPLIVPTVDPYKLGFDMIQLVNLIS